MFVADLIETLKQRGMNYERHVPCGPLSADDRDALEAASRNRTITLTAFADGAVRDHEWWLANKLDIFANTTDGGFVRVNLPKQ